MPKIIKFQCDASCCRREIEENEMPIGWTKIGSTDGFSLEIINQNLQRKIISAKIHSDIYFCSKICLINYFFRKTSDGQKKI